MPAEVGIVGQDAGGEHRVCGRETGAYDEGGGPGDVEEEVGEEGGDEPGVAHDGNQEREDGEVVRALEKPVRGELDAHSEALNGEDEAGEFLGEVVIVGGRRVRGGRSGGEDVED